jgi:hypothetical protein
MWNLGGERAHQPYAVRFAMPSAGKEQAGHRMVTVGDGRSTWPGADL